MLVSFVKISSRSTMWNAAVHSELVEGLVRWWGLSLIIVQTKLQCEIVGVRVNLSLNVFLLPPSLTLKYALPHLLGSSGSSSLMQFPSFHGSSFSMKECPI